MLPATPTNPNPPTHPATTRTHHPLLKEPELFKTTKLCTEDNRKAAAEKLAQKQKYYESTGRTIGK